MDHAVKPEFESLQKISMVNGAAFVSGEKQGNNRTIYVHQDLPLDLIYAILSRLPIKSIVRFKRLSKTWNSSIQSSYFFRLRRSINSTENLFLFVSPKPLKWPKGWSSPHVFLGNLVDHEDHRYFELNNSSRALTLKKQICANLDIQCVNGVFCFHPRFQTNGTWPRYSYSSRQANVATHIFNPTTRQVVTLPYDEDLDFYPDGFSLLTHFGYDSLKDIFKVLRVMLNKRGLFRKIKILTIGDYEWRDITQKIHCLLMPKICSLKHIGTCINGAIHWLDLTDKVIVVFDVGSEQFKEIPIFDGFSKYNSLIGEYDEHLCLVKFDAKKRLMEVSVLKDYENHVWIHERINEKCLFRNSTIYVEDAHKRSCCIQS